MLAGFIFDSDYYFSLILPSILVGFQDFCSQSRLGVVEAWGGCPKEPTVFSRAAVKSICRIQGDSGTEAVTGASGSPGRWALGTVMWWFKPVKQGRLHGFIGNYSPWMGSVDGHDSLKPPEDLWPLLSFILILQG